ncbi:MAG TPA: TonB-dependent receptor [Caulobacteraceae bacterium]|jgi:iron complex outermembrane receptor protein|nr:TonB-dependent receptor [Caulobacteraceae bacterium]
MQSKYTFRLACCSAIVLWAANASQAAAQAAPQPAEDKKAPAATAATVGEIIVTAQRREQSVQNVPIAMSALGSKALAVRGIVSLTDLQGVVPGLDISGSSGSNGTNLISIRGLVGQPIQMGAGEPTAVYLDGVYLPKPDGGFFGLEDVERIEVLRGPQGTLYGRNATAGAINIITKDPTQQLGGKIDASYGNFGTINVGGYLMGGLAPNLAASISGAYNRHDGYYDNTYTGDRVGDSSYWTLRGKLRYDSGAIRATLIGDISHKRFQDIWHIATLDAAGNPQVDPKYVSFNMPESQDRTTVDTRGVALTVDVRASDSLTISSISSYRTFSEFYSYDLDPSIAPTVQSLGLTKFNTFSQELRAAYASGPFRLTAGGNLYYEYSENRRQSNPSSYTTALLMADPAPFSTSRLTALAAFAQAEYDILPDLTLVAGLRLNHEKRDFTVDYSAVGPYTKVVGSVEDTAPLPAAGINFKPSRDVLLYAKVSEGYEAPGFANAPGAGAPANTFGPEKLWAYEAGWKTQFLDRRLTFNAAAFYYDYKDIQVREVTSPGVNQVVNAGAATIKGVEAEISLRPVPRLTLSAQATYAKAVYTKFCETISTTTAPQVNDPLCVGTLGPTANRAGNSLPQAPRWSGGTNIVYSLPLGNSRVARFSGTYAAESNAYYQSNNAPQVSTAGWYRLDARAELEFMPGYSVYLFGRNLTDKRYITDGFYYKGSGLVQLNDPRTFGVGVSAQF